MSEKALHPARIQPLNDLPRRSGRYVLYWMQQSQRAKLNHALEYAIQNANQLNQPLVVVFGLTASYPEANLRHYAFMLEGLKETQATLADRNILMVVRLGQPDQIALFLAREASLLVCDRGYLRHQKAWHRNVARRAGCWVVQVESDVVVPVDIVSNKPEYAARTIRPKLHRHLATFLHGFSASRVKKSSLDMTVKGLRLDPLAQVMDQLNLDDDVPPVPHILRGGTSQAETRFKRFLNEQLGRYTVNRNQPQTDDTSQMSPYLHFGQISPLQLALALQKTRAGTPADREACLEELIVRRELAVNYVNFTSAYDRYQSMPRWALKTLEEHEVDDRAHRYSRAELEQAGTHDVYWNAAMLEMRHTGYMHNYMRMYWGKKILEWSDSPQQAFETALAINNKYFIDGRDANSYAGVGWVFGLHDRAWPQRPIFGKVRYMAASGLERKCDIKGYVDKINERIRSRGEP